MSILFAVKAFYFYTQISYFGFVNISAIQMVSLFVETFRENVYQLLTIALTCSFLINNVKGVFKYQGAQVIAATDISGYENLKGFLKARIEETIDQWVTSGVKVSKPNQSIKNITRSHKVKERINSSGGKKRQPAEIKTLMTMAKVFAPFPSLPPQSLF